MRIHEVDTPELGEKGRQAAKKRLQQVLPKGQQVGLSEVLTKSYGRTVRRVTVKGKPINKLVAKAPKGV